MNSNVSRAWDTLETLFFHSLAAVDACSFCKDMTLVQTVVVLPLLIKHAQHTAFLLFASQQGCFPSASRLHHIDIR